MAFLAMFVPPSFFMSAFPVGLDTRFGENVIFHFALQVIHLFWASFFETAVGVFLDGCLSRGQGLDFRTRQI